MALLCRHRSEIEVGRRVSEVCCCATDTEVVPSEILLFGLVERGAYLSRVSLHIVLQLSFTRVGTGHLI